MVDPVPAQCVIVNLEFSRRSLDRWLPPAIGRRRFRQKAPFAINPAGVEITRTSEPNGRNRNGQGARLDTNFRPQNYGAVGKTLLATTLMAEFDFFNGFYL
jgi:hypothetical protein